MKPAPFDYVRPANLDAALAAVRPADPAARIMAGGQSLGPMMNLRLARPQRVMDIARLARLGEVTAGAATVSIGSGVTHAEIEDGAVPGALGAMMRAVARDIAYRAVRNKGTIGGSVAHADPAADWPSFLTALDAEVRIASAGGTRTEPMSRFVLAAYATTLAPGEIVTHLEVPIPGAGARFGYHKLCRKVGEFADAIGVAFVDPGRRRCRVVAGALGPRPVRLEETARMLASTARAPALEVIRTELAGATGETDAAKLQMVCVAVRRAVDEALDA